MLGGAQRWMYSSYMTLLLLGYHKASVFVVYCKIPRGRGLYLKILKTQEKELEQSLCCKAKGFSCCSLAGLG